MRVAASTEERSPVLPQEQSTLGAIDSGPVGPLDRLRTSKPLCNPFADDADVPAFGPEVQISTLDLRDTLLDEDRQKEIWDAEHVTHMLEWRFGKCLRHALYSLKHGAASVHFTPGLQGSVLDVDSAKSKSIAAISERYGDRTFLSSIACRRDDLVHWLEWNASRIDIVESSSFRVLFIDRDEPFSDKPHCWRARVLLSARGTRTAGTPIEWTSEHTVRFRWQDQEELDSGAVVEQWVVENFALRESSQTLMREVTEEAGFTALDLPDNWEHGEGYMLSMQIGVEDFDHDGYLDIALADGTGKQLLLRSIDGIRFKKAVTFPARSNSRFGVDFSVGVLDYDRDGYSDLLIGRRLYRNNQGRGFRDVTELCGLRFREAASMGYSVVDFDLDGHQDLYCNYSVEWRGSVPAIRGWIGDNESGAHNQLWRNRGDGTFEEVAAGTELTGGKRQTFASVWFHANDDGLPDLYVANDFSQNVLLINRGNGQFEDHSQQSRTADFATSMGAATGDFDNDGRSELYVANMYSKMGRRIVANVSSQDYPPGVFRRIQGACAGNRFYQRKVAEPEFEESSMELGVNDIGWAYAPATFDCDNDGNLDIYATTGFLSFDRQKPDG